MVEKKDKGGFGNNWNLETCKVTYGWKKDSSMSFVGKKRKGYGWKNTGTEENELPMTPGMYPTWTTSILKKDDISGNQMKAIESAVLKATCRRFDDTDFVFEDNDQAKEVMTRLKLVPGKEMALPATYNTDFNQQTDESFSRIFFHGIAAPLMARQGAISDENVKYGPYVVDISFLKDLDYRNKKMYKVLSLFLLFSLDFENY